MIGLSDEDAGPASRRHHGTVCTPSTSRLTAGLLLVGAAGQVPLSLLHPHQAQPNNSREAFTEYAGAGGWVEVHLGQYVGALLIALGLVTLALTLAQRPGVAGQLGRLAGVTAVVSAAVFAVQMAVDGVALKAAVDQWASAPAGQEAAAYGVAEGVRSLEKGLSALFHLNNGITILGWLGLAAGLGFLVTSVVTARTGFSPEAADVALLPTLLLMAFLVFGAWGLWRGARTNFGTNMEARS